MKYEVTSESTAIKMHVNGQMRHLGHQTGIPFPLVDFIISVLPHEN